MDINARQLGALEFKYLDQSETYQYCVDQLARVKGCQPMMAKLSDFVTPWETSMQAFDTAYRKMTTVQQTKTVKEYDTDRDSLYTGFAGTVSNAKKSPVQVQAAAAEQLDEVVKRYGVDTSGEYEQQTMRTEQLCADLLTNYQSQLTALGLTAWVEALRTKNQEFQAAMNARTNDQAGYVRSELSQLRLDMIAAYRNFVKMLNVVLIYEGDTAYATVVDQMNAEVRHYKQIITRKGGTVSGTTGNGGSNDNENANDNQGGTEQGGTEQGGGTGTITPGGDTPGGGDNNGGGSNNGGGGGDDGDEASES